MDFEKYKEHLSDKKLSPGLMKDMDILGKKIDSDDEDDQMDDVLMPELSAGIRELEKKNWEKESNAKEESKKLNEIIAKKIPEFEEEESKRGADVRVNVSLVTEFIANLDIDWDTKNRLAEEFSAYFDQKSRGVIKDLYGVKDGHEVYLANMNDGAFARMWHDIAQDYIEDLKKKASLDSLKN